MHRTPIAAATLFCTVSLAAGACSSKTAGTSGIDHQASAPPTSSHATTASAGSGASAAAGSAGITAFCTLITKNNAILMDIAAGDSPSGVDVTKLLHDLDTAVATAPAEIKSDVQTVVDFDRQILTNHTEIKETAQLDSAMQHYATWTGSHCATGQTP